MADRYRRGQPAKAEPGAHPRLKRSLTRAERAAEAAAQRAANAEVLLTEDAGVLEAEGMERTYKFSQEAIRENVDVSAAHKSFELSLDQFGPYRADVTRNGRHLLLGGKKGHLAAFDLASHRLGCELHVKETVRDVHWLHNESLFAVAQKKYAYIYDASGVEVHRLKHHTEPSRLDFLPHHFLLVSVGDAGVLHFQDTSTGEIAGEHRTRLGPCDVLTHNPYNAVVHLGHGNGVVSLWTPKMPEPVVKMFCHRAPVSAVAVDVTGHYMVTAGLDKQVKVWDVRTFKPVHAYLSAAAPATSLALSQRGLLAVGAGPHVHVWKDALAEKAQSPYLAHLLPASRVASLTFVPFEDVLAVGHARGYASLLVPGAGEPNFDALEANPYENSRQRRETEVKQLLDKIQPDAIMLDPNAIGRIARTNKEEQIAIAEAQREANARGDEAEHFEPRHRKRGRSSAKRRFLRKQQNVIDERRAKMRELMAAKERKRHGDDDVDVAAGPALSRFKRTTRTVT